MILTSARDFVEAIRFAPDYLDTTDVVKFLENAYDEHLQGADSLGLPKKKRDRAFFWSGVLLGMRIESRRYRLALEQRAHEMGIDPATGKKKVADS